METKETRKAPPRRPRASAPQSRSGAPVKQKRTTGRRPAPAAKKEQAAKRQPLRKAAAAPKPRPQNPSVEIVYTPPKPFDKKKLALQIGIVVAVVLAVFFGLSLFFKVSAGGINVSGNDRYSAQSVVDAAGIRTGDSLLALNKPQISSRIITKLPYVSSVRVGIKLPGTVNIMIEELDVVYTISEPDGTSWIMNSDGKLIEKTDAAAASEHTKVLGVTLDLPVAGQQAVAKEAEPAGTLPEGETQPVTISAAQRLQTALTILQYLEQNDVMGEVVSVDVTDMGSLKLQYGDRFAITLGDATDLSYKIEMAIQAVGQLAEHDRGNLDVSFVVRPEVIFTPHAD